MSTSNVIEFKQGDTVNFPCSLTEDDVAVDLTAWAITSQVRDKSGTLICSFTCVKDADQVNNKGKFYLTLAEAASLACSYGNFFCDIEYRLAGEVMSTETFGCVIDRNVTTP